MKFRKTYRGPVFRLFKEQEGRCIYCKRQMFLIGEGDHPLFATKEHRVARSKQGSNTKENLAASCLQCNTMKDSLSEAEFVAMLARHNGDIHALTEECLGKDLADIWRRRSEEPIPEQPPMPVPPPPKRKTVARIVPKKAPIKKLKVVPQKVTRVLYVVHVYSLVTHTAVKKNTSHKSRARLWAKSIARNVVGDLRLAVCRIDYPTGESVWLYHSYDPPHWRWTDG